MLLELVSQRVAHRRERVEGEVRERDGVQRGGLIAEHELVPASVAQENGERRVRIRRARSDRRVGGLAAERRA
jgi:hypothetical protein